MSRLRFALLLAPLPAVVFLVHDGYFASSDGMIHLYRLFELDRALHDGILYPRWFPLSGYGYGLPVLNYYPPLSYYLGELFNLAGAGYIGSIKLLIAVGFFAAFFSMFVFTRDLLGNTPAFIAAVAYAYLPYFLSDAYVRGNFPEFLAMSILPLCLLAFRRLFDRSHPGAGSPGARPTPVWGLKIPMNGALQISAVMFAGIVFAAIILTHHLTALLFAPLLGAYVLLLFAGQRDWTRLIAAAGAVLVGLALSAFYWLPSIAELNLVYVGPASVARFLVSRLVGLADFIAPSLAYEYIPQGEVLKHAFGLPQTLIALIIGAVALVAAIRIQRTERRSRTIIHAIFFALVVVTSILMTLSFSAPLWYAIPVLRFIQFPWRFEILTGIGIAFLLGLGARWIAAAAARSSASNVAYASVSLVLIALGVANLPVRWFPLTDAAVDLSRAADSDYVIAQAGWSWTREFVPSAAQDVDAVYSPTTNPTALAPAVAQDVPSVQLLQSRVQSAAVRISTPKTLVLSLHTFYFPEWQAYVDNSPAPTFPRGSLGLVSVSIPPGDHVVSFQFQDTPIRVVASAITLLSSLVCVVALLLVRHRATIVCFGALAIVGVLFIAHSSTFDAGSLDLALTPPTSISAILDDRVMLVGYAADRADYHPGETIYVTLYWFALSELDKDYQVFVHLTGQGDASLVQHDGPPDQGLTPTTRWLPGEIIADRHALALGSSAPGEYRLVAGMYLPVDNGFIELGDQIELGRVKVVQ